MGIKMKVCIGLGAAVLAGIAGFFARRKARKEQNERVAAIIRNVDDKAETEPEKEPEDVEDISKQVNQAIRDMGIEEEPQLRILDDDIIE